MNNRTLFINLVLNNKSIYYKILNNQIDYLYT